MRTILIAILLSVALAQNYQIFTADFQAVSPQWGTGYFTGKFKYDWPAGAMSITFDDLNAYSETYIFNTDKGYNPNVATGQFTYQYLYKVSQTCPCETSALQYGMPAIYPSSISEQSPGGKLDFWNKPGISPVTDKFYKGDAATSTQYFANGGLVTTLTDGSTKAYFLSSNFVLDKNGVPAAFALRDDQSRTFNFLNVVPSSVTLGIKAPTEGCKCGKLLDIVLSLDRSGSIQNWQWALEYAFVKNLSQAFEYDPAKANFGLVNWNSKQWTTIDILSGNSPNNVNTAINSMGCCPGSKTGRADSCCCCGTPIGGGIWGGAYMLSKSPRNKATKVLVVLTDGCQNHIWTPPDNPAAPNAAGTATSCGCANEQACATNTACTGDITKWFDWTKKNIPGVKVLAVGVGDSTTICKDQLLLAAGGDPTNVYNPQNWDQLQTIVQTISATACTTDSIPCPNCCGNCICGVCYPPKNCYDKDKCNKGVVDTATGCCGTEPVECTAGPCEQASCVPATGCQVAPITCKPPELCFEWYCNATSIDCALRPIVPTPADCGTVIVIPECVDNTDCDDNNKCTNDTCVSGTCSHTNIGCPSDDACESWQCLKTVGCKKTIKPPCNDNNRCTTDVCDPVKGCVYTPVSCFASKDPCVNTTCRPEQGCLNETVTCSNLTATNCSVPICNVTCYLDFICYAPPPSGEEFPSSVVIGASLGGAAVAGIVIAAVLILGGAAAGGAVAIAGAAGAGGVVMVSSNPVYVGAGTAGNNPLHKDN